MLTPSLLVFLVIETVLAVVWFIAGLNSVKIIGGWDSKSDGEAQLKLEALAELMMLLLSFGMILTITSLFLLIFTAEALAPFLTGAMCGFGVFTANNYGSWLLIVKLALSVLAALWIIFNVIDRTNPNQPYLKKKFMMIPLLGIINLFSLGLTYFWLTAMNPDTLVSCCGDLFNGEAQFILPAIFSWFTDVKQLSILYISLMVLHLLFGLFSLKRKKTFILFPFSAISILPVGILVIVLIISTYAFENPVHRCPFCLLQEADAVLHLLIVFGLWLSTVTGIGTLFFSVLKEEVTASIRAQELIKSLLVISMASITASTMIMGIVIITSNYTW